MTQVTHLHEVKWNDSDSTNCFYEFNINRPLTTDELEVVESAIEKVLDNKGIEVEVY